MQAGATAAKPSVSSVSPHDGATAGGATVTIHGKNFAAGSKVEFGSADAAHVTRTNATTLTATAPKHAPGTVDVRVITGAGTSAKASADQFTYWAPPKINSLSPAKGLPGTKLTITGTSFHHVTKVTFGSTKAAKVTTLSATKLQVTAPSHAAGKAAIRVTTAYGTSAPATFTFLAAPQLHSTAIPLPAGVHDPNASFTGMSCPVVRWCALAGTYEDSDAHTQGALDIWSNGSWTPTTAPVPNGYTQVQLEDLSCVSASLCYAVGTAFGPPGEVAVIEAYDGQGWTSDTVPEPSDYKSNGNIVHIGCSSGGVCAAVGSYFVPASGGGSTSVGSLFRISAGAIVASKFPAVSGEGSLPPELGSVACDNTGSCVAVGMWSDSSFHAHPLVVSNSGGAWNARTAPLPSGYPVGQLYSVECSHGCHASGTAATSPSGSQAAILETLAGTDSVSLIATDTGVSSAAACASASVCAAYFGRKNSGTSTSTSYLAYLAGGKWSAAEAPLVNGATYFSVRSITCPTTSCVAAGQWTGSGTPTFGIATYENGTWLPSAAPAVAGTSPLGVIGLACPADGACVVATSQTLLTEN